jgi:hypothetical protein
MKNQLSTEEMTELENIVQAVEGMNLKGWDATFIGDFKTKFEQYGARTYVSPKQWTHLRRIYEDNTDIQRPVDRQMELKYDSRSYGIDGRDPRDVDDEVPF